MRDQLKAALQADAEMKAEKYQADDFARNPNGYTVAPYVNSETLSTAFEAGANSRTELICELVEALDLATDLLTVPERHQDAEWAANQDKVVAVFLKVKNELGIK